MPMPLWVGKVNKRYLNPAEVRKGSRPVLVHTGRVSGATHETPLDAHPVEGGYAFILVYGQKSDWVRNVLADGKATLRTGGRNIALGSPRVISGSDAWSILPADAKRPPALLNISEILRMNTITA